VPASGSTFSLGATTVSCRSQDRLGRQASCGFVVTLEPSVIGVKAFVAFGDSVTLGENALPGPAPAFAPLFIDTPNAYPTKLRATFDADFPGQAVTVTNEGKSAERATDGPARLPGVLALRKPGGLLLLHGYNDLLADGIAGAGPVAAALGDMVRLARTAGVSYVFVSTITPSRPGQRQISPAAILETNFRIRQMAAVEGAVLVDAYDAFFGQEAVLVGNDGLHLTPAGNQVLAATFYTAIRNRVPASLLSAPARAPGR
jgi:lysophospholipase L1-like esterase